MAHRFTRLADADVGQALLAVGHEGIGAGVCEREAQRARVRELGLAGGIFDLGLFGEGVADAGPEILLGCGGDDGGVEEDVRRRVGIGVSLE